MAEYMVTTEQLKAIADKIRSKTGTATAIEFYTEFVSEIEKLTDTRSGTATAADILSGKIAYANKNKIVGNIPSKAAATYGVSPQDQVIAAGQYLSGAQTIKGVAHKAAAIYNTSSADQIIQAGQYLNGAQTIRKVKTTNLSPENVKAGVTVKVGDEADDDRIAGIAGTFTADANATAADILQDKTAYVNGEQLTGSIPLKAAENFWTSTDLRTLSAGQYLSGIQYIRPVSTSNIYAENIKRGVRVRVGDTDNSGRIKDVTGTYISDFNYVTTGQVRIYLGQSTAETIYSRHATVFAAYSTYPILSDYNVIAAGITREDQIIALLSADTPTIYDENGNALGLKCYIQTSVGNGHTRGDTVYIRAVNLTNDAITYPGGNCYIWASFSVYYHPDAL